MLLVCPVLFIFGSLYLALFCFVLFNSRVPPSAGKTRISLFSFRERHGSDDLCCAFFSAFKPVPCPLQIGCGSLYRSGKMYFFQMNTFKETLFNHFVIHDFHGVIVVFKVQEDDRMIDVPEF